MKKLISDNRYFLIPQLLFVLAGLFIILFYGKPESHIILNKLNAPFIDVFFKYLTWLGDGLIFIPALIILTFVKYRHAIVLALSIILSNIFVQAGKHLLFPKAMRPSKFFEEYSAYKLHFVEGVNLHGFHSFPSGHSAAAFLVFLIMAMLVRSNMLKLSFFIIAMLIAFSRVYLSQHFMVDIVAGSVIATVSCIAVWVWIGSSEKLWLNGALGKKHYSK